VAAFKDVKLDEPAASAVALLALASVTGHNSRV
jgi:hypothetical protein